MLDTRRPNLLLFHHSGLVFFLLPCFAVKSKEAEERHRLVKKERNKYERNKAQQRLLPCRSSTTSSSPSTTTTSSSTLHGHSRRPTVASSSTRFVATPPTETTSTTSSSPSSCRTLYPGHERFSLQPVGNLLLRLTQKLHHRLSKVPVPRGIEERGGQSSVPRTTRSAYPMYVVVDVVGEIVVDDVRHVVDVEPSGCDRCANKNVHFANPEATEIEQKKGRVSIRFNYQMDEIGGEKGIQRDAGECYSWFVHSSFSIILVV